MTLRTRRQTCSPKVACSRAVLRAVSTGDGRLGALYCVMFLWGVCCACWTPSGGLAWRCKGGRRIAR